MRNTYTQTASISKPLLQEHLNRGWSMFKKYFWGFLGAYIINFILLIAVNSLVIRFIYTNYIGLDLEQGGLVNLPKYFGYALIANLFWLIIHSSLYSGFYLMAHSISKKQVWGFGKFFGGFKSFAQIAAGSFLINLVLVVAFSLVFYVISYVSDFVFDEVRDFTYSQIFLIMMSTFFVLSFPALYLFISYWLALPLILFKSLKPWQAMETSRKVVSTHIGFFILLFLIFYLTPVLTMFFPLPIFLIVLTISVPLCFTTTYSIYEYFFDEDQEEVLLDEIGKE